MLQSGKIKMCKGELMPIVPYELKKNTPNFPARSIFLTVYVTDKIFLKKFAVQRAGGVKISGIFDSGKRGLITRIKIGNQRGGLKKVILGDGARQNQWFTAFHVVKCVSENGRKKLNSEMLKIL